MDGMEPYTGYEEYDYGMTDPSASAETKTSSETGEQEQDTPPPVIAGILDPSRHNEIDIPTDKSTGESSYSASYYRYDELPTIATHHNPGRVSIHPLGITSQPSGVTESYWKQLDADRLFQPVYEPTFTVESIGSETESTLPTAVSGGLGGNSGSSPVEEVEERDPTEMPFLDHLEEFRWALLKSLFIIAFCMILSWFISDVFFATITRLANQAELPLVTTKLLETLMIKLQMALVMGIVIALPFVLYFVWSFIAPGLYKKEKKWFLPLIMASTVCFFIGASIAYFIIIPFMLTFIKNFIYEDIAPMITIGNFIGLLLKFTIMFGLLFQMPLLSYVLAKIGIIKYTWMSQYRKYAIIVIFIIGALITPPDPLSQVMMAGPLILLYEISIITARIAGQKTLI
ncbi:twin-arginine translocase subunit TatC [Candidatus Latescibacterota bacterium]